MSLRPFLSLPIELKQFAVPFYRDIDVKIDNDSELNIANGGTPNQKDKKPMHFNIEINFNSLERKHLESKYTNLQLASTPL